MFGTLNTFIGVNFTSSSVGSCKQYISSKWGPLLHLSLLTALLWASLCIYTMYVHVHIIYTLHPWTLFHSRYLMVNPKDYRVVIVEPLLCPTSFRNTLARAFFNHFSVRHMHVIIVIYMYKCGAKTALFFPLKKKKTGKGMSKSIEHNDK